MRRSGDSSARACASAAPRQLNTKQPPADATPTASVLRDISPAAASNHVAATAAQATRVSVPNAAPQTAPRTSAIAIGHVNGIARCCARSVRRTETRKPAGSHQGVEKTHVIIATIAMTSSVRSGNR